MASSGSTSVNIENTPPKRRPKLSDLNNFSYTNETIILSAKPLLSHLPPDVLLLILGYFPRLSILETIEASELKTVLPDSYRDRLNVLRALSQTCRTLRAVCLSMAWEDVQACTWDNREMPVSNYVSYILKKQCYGLMKYPDLACHVKYVCLSAALGPLPANFDVPLRRSVTVSLLHSPAHYTLKQFARCLESLPNLHTLQILSCSYSDKPLETEFKNKTYPTVKTVVLPPIAHPIVSSCFAVDKVYVCRGPGSYSKLALAVAANCPYVEVFHCVNISQHDRLVIICTFALLRMILSRFRTHICIDF